jgi:hypothetical protein
MTRNGEVTAQPLGTLTATPGEWRKRFATTAPRSITAAAIGQPGDVGIGFDGDSSPDRLNMIGEVWAERVRGQTDAYQAAADAEFICAARTALPLLLAEVRRLRADKERLDHMERFLRRAADEFPDMGVGFDIRVARDKRSIDVVVTGPDDCYSGATLREAIDDGRVTPEAHV